MVSKKAGLVDAYALAKLAAAEQLLACEEQWCKGALRDRQGRHCVLGALDATGGRYLLAPVVLRAAREVSGKRYWRIESFNDNPRTTHADVLRALRRAREKIIAKAARPATVAASPRAHAETLRALCAGLVSTAKRRLAQATDSLACLSLQPAVR